MNPLQCKVCDSKSPADRPSCQWCGTSFEISQEEAASIRQKRLDAKHELEARERASKQVRPKTDDTERYAGFWARFVAAVVDFFVFLPLMFAVWYLMDISRIMSVFGNVIGWMSWTFYNIYLHGRFGQTVGKMAAGVKVFCLDGSSITWKQALVRHSVDLGLGLLSIVAISIATFQISDADYQTLDWVARTKKIKELQPWALQWVSPVATIWAYSELIVLLFNKKRRALHDFLAGTVVIHIK